MRNLAVQYHKINNIKEILEQIYPELHNELQTNSFAATTHNDDLFIASSTGFYHVYFDSDDSELCIEKMLDIINSRPAGMEYWSDNESIVIAYESGDLVKLTLDQPTYEVATHFDGLKCIQLSPDQEILVLVTANDKVITMISNLQVISEADLNSEDFGEKQFITVGWGHKATQFHGSEGKAAATAKEEIIGRTQKDSGMSCITWRGDGVLFAVSYLNEKSNIRQFKVFNREGILQYTSELIHGLEEIISWRPSGNYIAAIQQLSDKQLISFFEKNGLKHREFILPFKPDEVKIKQLCWSPDSEILTLWLLNDQKDILQLWTMNNYHWYLKQTIEFGDDYLVYLAWSTATRANKRLILLTKTKLMIYVFRWAINHSRCMEMKDKAVVGVVDGDKVLLTGFKVGIVPPPMCHHSQQINCSINECFFAPKCQDDGNSWLNPNSFWCLLQNNELALCVYQDDDFLSYKYIRSYKIEWKVPEIEMKDIFYCMHHFLWFKANIILCSLSSSSSSTSSNINYLCVIHLENVHPDEENGRIVIREALKVERQIEHIVASPDVDVAYILVGHHVLKYIHGEGVRPTEIIIPESCDQVEVIEIEKHHLVVTLGRTNRLFIDGVEVANNITSISVHSEFLLLTTLQHALVCVTMNAESFGKLSMSNLTVQPWTSGSTEHAAMGLSMRRLERSSSLVMSIPHESKVILQMKRGNLEAIQPRALSLHIIKTHLNVLNYFEAFDIMRKQRINLNLIYDHNPKLFIRNAEKFVDSIKNSQWLNLFISDLQEEDVTETIYKACYNEQENESRRADYEVPEEGKVESICQLLRSIMEMKARNLVQPILTSLVKNKHVPGLEAALRKIKDIKIKEGIHEDRQQSSDEALKYLLYLVDVDILYNIALGMYDLDLTKYVAAKSQKDPKEYLPYLKKLAEFDDNYRKFKIDMDLRRYESALNHIARCHDKFDQCIDLISNHDLYAKAIKLFAKDQKEYMEIARIYGQYLSRNKRYREAGLMFQRSGDFYRALQMHQMAGSWQDAIIVSTQMNMSPGELNELYNDLVNQLRDDRRYRDAAEISLAYLDNPEDAVSMMCDAKEWRDALRITHTAKRLDLIETHINPGVHQHAIDIYLKITKNKEEFVKLKKRLMILRIEKAKKAAAFDALEEEPGKDFSDLLSDTTSIAGSTTSLASKASRTSVRSYRSSKNKRKQERKVLSIKEGSAFEDLAIIRAIHLIISNSYAQREEVCAVNRLLVCFYFDEIAEKLQNALMDMLGLIEKDKYEIWTKDLNTEYQLHETNLHMPAVFEPKFRYPPEIAPCNWILEIFSPPIKAINSL